MTEIEQVARVIDPEAWADEYLTIYASRKHSPESYYARNRPAALAKAQAILNLIKPEGWRPIETAPRDGASVLAAYAKTGYMVAVCWNEHERGWVDGSTDHYGDLEIFAPDYWRPLPPPPVSP